jgi:hypothetical protein
VKAYPRRLLHIVDAHYSPVATNPERFKRPSSYVWTLALVLATLVLVGLECVNWRIAVEEANAKRSAAASESASRIVASTNDLLKAAFDAQAAASKAEAAKLDKK